MSKHIYKNKTGENSQYDGQEIVIIATETKPEDLFKEDVTTRYRVSTKDGTVFAAEAGEIIPVEPTFFHIENEIGDRVRNAIDGSVVGIYENGVPILYCGLNTAEALLEIIENSPYRGFEYFLNQKYEGDWQ